jgi:ABC-type multidrug transport system ATPase subunit
MISTQHLTKLYGEIHALNDVSLTIREGEFVALLGPNGSGKSTLFRSLLGIQEYQGRISVNGCDPLRQGKETRKHIGYMPQQSGLHGELSVMETINFYCRVKRSDTTRAMGLLEEVQLDKKLSSKVSELSGGMRQRLAFAVAMLADPQVLLLDEPTASLDSRSQVLILDWLKHLHSKGKTILISTHSKVDIMSLAVRSITLEEGTVVSDLDIQSIRESRSSGHVIVTAPEPVQRNSKEGARCLAI